MSEYEPSYNPEGEHGAEFDEAEAWKKLAEIARNLFPDLEEEDITYLAGLGVTITIATNHEGQSIAEPEETHKENLADTLGEVYALVLQYGVDEELNQRLMKAGIIEEPIT